MPIIVFKTTVDENNSAVLKFNIKDPDGAIPTGFTSATLSIYVEKTATILTATPSPNAIDVSSNIDANGLFRYIVPAKYNIIESTAAVDSEDHLAVLTVVFTTTEGTHQGQFNFRITVNNNKML